MNDEYEAESLPLAPTDFTLGPTSYNLTVGGGMPVPTDRWADHQTLPGAVSATRMREIDVKEKVNDIPVEIEAVIGRTRISVAKLMASGEGDLLRLDIRFGDPVELQVNGRVIGHGELIADERENFIGIRMTAVQPLRPA